MCVLLQLPFFVVCDGVNSTAGRKLQACSETLYVFAKCVPKFLVRHASHLLPYLSEKGTVRMQSDCSQYDTRLVHLLHRRFSFSGFVSGKCVVVVWAGLFERIVYSVSVRF